MNLPVTMWYCRPDNKLLAWDSGCYFLQWNINQPLSDAVSASEASLATDTQSSLILEISAVAGFKEETGSTTARGSSTLGSTMVDMGDRATTPSDDW